MPHRPAAAAQRGSALEFCFFLSLYSSQNVSTNAVSWKYLNDRLSGIADIPVNKEWFGVSYHAENRYLVSSNFAPFNQ